VLTKQRRNTRLRLPVPQRALSHGVDWHPASAKEMTSEPFDFDLRRFIPYQLVVLAGYVGTQLLRAYSRHGISVPEWRVLAITAANPSITANEIAARVQLDEISVHRAVTSLIERKLLRRTTDAKDRRKKLLHLTPSGKATYRAIIPLATEFEAWMLAKLPQTQRKGLVVALRDLCKRLQLSA
jgi:DNA-binding MarR family transcriptional regulator